jgi:hypothetical protein
VAFKGLVQALGDAVIVADPEERVRLWTPVRDQTTRWTEEQALRRRLVELERGARPG